MVGVVGVHVPDTLVHHGEESVESPQSRVVHDVLQAVTELETFVHESVGGKVRGQYRRAVSLDLGKTQSYCYTK